MAAMASPLLEAGAIDGAKGILINITGSSSLKLSEVNEASSIIQGAAHEDANIIFGAVLDETMGDELKITVIATGFRQKEMPERRERMLAETTMPGSRWDAPIAPRVQVVRQPVQASSAVAREPMPVAAREPEPVRGAEAQGTEIRATAPVMTPLVPLPAVPLPVPIEASLYRAPAEVLAKGPAPRSAEPAMAGAETARVSVFDDDFFRRDRPMERESGPDGRAGERKTERGWESPDLSGVRNVQSIASRADVFYVQAASGPVQTAAASESGRSQAPVADAASGEPDELDIPAFLRRGH